MRKRPGRSIHFAFIIWLTPLLRPRRSGVPDPLDVYQFMWDRTRMIRKDFTLQNYTGYGKNDAAAVRCHERIARWHIMMEHQLAEIDDFVVKQR